MAIALHDIHPPDSKDLTIVVRNHRDGEIGILPPGVEKLAFGGRWLDAGAKCTEFNITTTYGRAATITLEDNGRYELYVSGNVRGGHNSYRVDGSKDFDVYFTVGGAIELRTRDGSGWDRGASAVIRLDVIPLVRSS